MIVIDRKSGKTIRADPITPEQNQVLWEALVREQVRIELEKIKTAKGRDVS